MSQVLAIDIGGTNTKLALVDSTGKTGEVISIATSNQSGQKIFLESIVSAIQKDFIDKHQIKGVGVGVAGFVDADHTSMIFNPNIAWLEGVNLKDFFSDKLQLPVYIEIDSNAAALAEYVYGNGRGCHRLLVLTIGTGLGGGMIVDGEILRISNECLGDIGHVLVAPGDFQCAAGCKGCAEAMVSASALERFAAEFISMDKKSNLYKALKFEERLRTPDIIKAALDGDIASKKSIAKLGSYLGIAIASMTPIFAPERICIAGGVSEAGSMLLTAARNKFDEVVGPPYADGVNILKAKMGWKSVLIGSAEAFRNWSKITG